MTDDTLISKMTEVFLRTQGGFKTDFKSVTIECGSWNSAYQYIVGDNGDAKEVNAFSVSLKSMHFIECAQDGSGKVVIHIDRNILEESQCQ